MNALYFCCQENRRDLVLASGALNGIDFLEVLDDPSVPLTPWQRILAVHFLKPLPTGSGGLTRDNIRITGGERIRNVGVLDVATESEVLTVRVNKAGDFSTYSLSLTKAADASDPPDGFDPVLSAIDFSFKVECPSDFDCRADHICPPEVLPAPEIDYLAKDYASFRQLMLDRMSVVMPQWQERNAADLGITLVELLAHVGDHLSYTQDAIATEAYLGTAQRRTSVRRHARLVDYFMHHGSNARVWVQIALDPNGPGSGLLLAKGTPLMTAADANTARLAPTSAELEKALRSEPEVFETMHDALLFAAHAEMEFYTGGDAECCLPKGSTRATLRDDPAHRLRLRAGDVLIVEERLGPLTGLSADADPMRRHAVRLTKVSPEAQSLRDAQGKETDRTAVPPLLDPLTSAAIVEIEWSMEDALPFPLCLSSITDTQHKAQSLANVSVASGNIILADHGLTIPDEDIGTVPAPTLQRLPSRSGDRCQPRDPISIPPRFRPRLSQAPLTMAATATVTEIVGGQSRQRVVAFDPNAPAVAAFAWDLGRALPVVSLNDHSWHPQRDLLGSDAVAQEFVVELEEDGRASLRFGDEQHGQRPDAGEKFRAHYRVGNGRRGNIGRESLAHVVTAEPAIVGLRNPLPASGGADPETIEEVRQAAPNAFRVQERAVTPADYAEVALRHPGIQNAAATFRWTGSWRTVFLTLDRIGGLDVDADFQTEMRAHMERYRMAGHELEINGPLYVSLEIAMTICTKADYFRGDVEAALLQVFSNRVLPDGTRGLFHPDNFSFGQTVYLSAIYAAAMKVEGVGAVKITTFQRQAAPDSQHLALTAGKLALGRLEIARLDNDPNFREHGVLRLTMEDGK